MGMSSPVTTAGSPCPTCRPRSPEPAAAAATPEGRSHAAPLEPHAHGKAHRAALLGRALGVPGLDPRLAVGPAAVQPDSPPGSAVAGERAIAQVAAVED